MEEKDKDLTIDSSLDLLQVYFGDDYKIKDGLTIHQPTIGEVVEWGENKYFSMVNTICSIPSDMKSFLFDNGVMWEEITDFDFFILMTRPLTPSQTSIVFGENIDFSKLKFYVKKEDGSSVLFDEETGFAIEEEDYNKMINYIRCFNNIHPNVERAFNQRTRTALIEVDRQKIAESKDKKFTSYLLPIISAMLNHSGFKYKKTELREVGLYEFFDSVQRIQIIMNTTGLLNGMYSGMVDTSKIKKKEFNWLREIDTGYTSGENLRIPDSKKSND